TPSPVSSDDLFDLSGQVAVVTGTSRGLGQHFARALAKAGADLILTSRNLDTLAPFEREIKSLGRRAASFALDVRDHASIQKFVADAESAFGQIHFFVAQGIARGMIQHNYGRIINVGSVTSVAGFAGLGPYGASRGGIRQLTMSLADDWGRHGITVNCLAPGWFRTDQNKIMYEDKEWVEYLCDRIPLKRPGRPDDLESAVVFLAAESSRYVTGQTLLVDGGISTGATRALVQPAQKSSNSQQAEKKSSRGKTRRGG